MSKSDAVVTGASQGIGQSTAIRRFGTYWSSVEGVW